MVIFNSYVKLPEGNYHRRDLTNQQLELTHEL